MARGMAEEPIIPVALCASLCAASDSVLAPVAGEVREGDLQKQGRMPAKSRALEKPFENWAS